MTKNNASVTFDRRDFLIKAGGGAILALTKNLFSYQKTAKQVNILLIITDQQHIDTIAAGGCPYVKTPALDRLKNRGFSFKLSYSPNSVCSPARASILTGRTSSETGVINNSLPIRKHIPNLGQWFSKNSNYETYYAGKWHLPKPFSGSVPGFNMLCTGGHAGYIHDEILSRACEGFIRNQSLKNPFLLVTNFTQPHDVCIWLRENYHNSAQLRYENIRDELPPLPQNFDFAGNEFTRLKNRRDRDEPIPGKWDELHWRYYLWSYYRQIEDLDGEIGRILQACEERGFLENTLIIFTSDHGEGLAHHTMVRKNTPYDESSRVPLIISWPGQIPEGRDNSMHLVSGMDILPTCCDYAGIPTPAQTKGLSLRPILEGDSAWRSYLVTELNDNSIRMVRTAQYKYVIDLAEKKEMLFDMKHDPGEMQNLVESAGAGSLLKEHRQMLRKWEKKLKVPSDIPFRDAWKNI